MLFGVFFGSFIFFLCSMIVGDKSALYYIVGSTLCGFEGYFMLREFFGALGAFLDIVDDSFLDIDDDEDKDEDKGEDEK